MDRKPLQAPREEIETTRLAPTPLHLATMLPPKGACWYCDKPLDAVRRFCCKSCSEAYAEEAQFSR